MLSVDANESLKKMPKASVKLRFLGDLILAQCDEAALARFFRRYQVLFETLANFDKKQRTLAYKMLSALILTSYAKKSTDLAEKKNLFDLKNKLFVSIAQRPDLRSMLEFKYLTSKNFRVSQYCDRCSDANTADQREKYRWRHCKECTLDRNFYNLISMRLQFTEGYICIGLSHDQLCSLPFGKPKNRGKVGDQSEEAKIDRYLFGVKNLDAIDYASTLEMFEKLKSI